MNDKYTARSVASLCWFSRGNDLGATGGRWEPYDDDDLLPRSIRERAVTIGGERRDLSDWLMESESESEWGGMSGGSSSTASRAEPIPKASDRKKKKK